MAQRTSFEALQHCHSLARSGWPGVETHVWTKCSWSPHARFRHAPQRSAHLSLQFNDHACVEQRPVSYTHLRAHETSAHL
eukprot:12514049-Alexandrium_andersonii.AAC.1